MTLRNFQKNAIHPSRSVHLTQIPPAPDRSLVCERSFLTTVLLRSLYGRAAYHLFEKMFGAHCVRDETMTKPNLNYDTKQNY